MRLVTFFLAVVLFASIQNTAQAAIVQRINDEKDRLIVELTSKELENAEEGQRVEFETEDPRFDSAGTMRKINAEKKTAVIILEQADDRYYRRQKLTFLSFLRNSVYSHMMRTITQYHLFPRPLVAGQAGYSHLFYETKTSDDAESDEAVTESTYSGYHVGGEGYVSFDQDFFGLGFSYERRNFQSVTKSDDSAQSNDDKLIIDVDYIKPAAWVQAKKNWRLGIQLDYFVVATKEEESGVSLGWNFLTPVLAMLYSDRDVEYGAYYRERAQFEAFASVSPTPGGSTRIKFPVKVPAEFSLFCRSISSPTFAWGTSVGWIFYERELAEDQPIRRDAGPEEMLRLDLGFEHRLESGSKIEWALAYSGAQAPSPLVITPQQTNQLNIHLGYHRPVLSGFLFGGRLVVGGGTLTIEEESKIEGAEPQETATTSYGGTIAFIVQKDFQMEDSQRR